MNQEKLGYLATCASFGVLVGMWILKDHMVAAMALPSTTRERLRRGILRLRGMQDYAGRHRQFA